MRDCVTGFTEVQTNDTCSPSLVHGCSHSILEGYGVGQAGLALGEAVSAALSLPPVPHEPQQSF